MTNNHGRAERVLVTKATLEMAAGACVSAVHGLQKSIHSDKALQDDLARMASHLQTIAKQKPYKLQHRAPKGHAIVPKDLLREAIGDICDGANEFEDAAGYCNDSDAECCESHGSGMRRTARKLGRYVR